MPRTKELEPIQTELDLMTGTVHSDAQSEINDNVALDIKQGLGIVSNIPNTLL